MSVYVDDMYKRLMGKLGRMKMSHMVADTTQELLEMADKIGVQRKWIQKAGTHQEHFDVPMQKRLLAIQYGAKEVTMRELAEICSLKKLENDSDDLSLKHLERHPNVKSL